MKRCRRWIAAMLLAILIVTTMIPITASAKQEDFKNRVVGYFPSYRYSTFNSVDFSAMTHCILSFLTYSNGTLTCGFSDAQIRAIKEKCDANDVKLMVALGGWDGFSYTNNPIDTDEERQKFVADLMYYVDSYDLDGIDIDVEITNSDFWACFDLLVKDLSAELKPDGKLLTMAVATWFTDPIADSTYEYFDFINLMSYYGTGYDSHMNQIYNYLTYYGNRGVSDDRMVIGVPFYGNSSGANPTYGEIIAMSTDASMLNYYNGINYNGAHTITAKAEYSLDYGGIMIWEVGQDSFNKRYSLLEAIKRVNDTTGTATDIGYLANLNSSKTTCTSTKLSWTASENAVSYKIYNDN